MRRPPRLIAELIALTTSDGRSLAEVARELEVDETTLMQYRSGRRPISMKSYAKIMRRFSEHRLIRDLAAHYAAVEYHMDDEQSTKLSASPLVPLVVERAIAQYAERFAEATLHGGRGLYLIGPDRALSAVSQFVAQLFESAKVPICRIRGGRKPVASEVRGALAAPLFVVERIDFLHHDVASLIRRRADLLRPTVVTSMQGPEAVLDAHLRRILTSSMRLIDIAETGEVQRQPMTSKENAAT